MHAAHLVYGLTDIELRVAIPCFLVEPFVSYIAGRGKANVHKVNTGTQIRRHSPHKHARGSHFLILKIPDCLQRTRGWP